MTAMDPRVAYVVSRYPLITHTFVQREVLGLREAGYEVTTFSVRATDPEECLSEVDRAEAASTVVLTPPGPRAAVRGLLVPCLRHPRAVTRVALLAARGHWSNPAAVLWRLFYLAEALLLWRECRDRNIRRIHAHHGNVAADLAWLACEFGQETEGARSWCWTFTLHGPREFMAVKEHDLARKAASAQSVVCISDFTRSQLMLHTDTGLWTRFQVVHCGVDTGVFTPPQEPSADGRPFTVLSLGRMTPQKGFPVLIEAMADLQAQVHTPVRLLVGGDGPDRRRLARTAERLGLDVDFLGAVPPDQVLGLYHRADAFCLPSFMEGLPVVLMEAMACGLPVVATDVAGIGELVEGEVTGLTVQPGRPDLIADQLRRLASEPDLARRLGTEARARVIREFDIAQTVSGMRRVFAGNTGPSAVSSGLRTHQR